MENVFQAPRLLDIIFKMTGSLIYKRGILNFTSQLKFPEEDVFYAPGLLDLIFKMTGSPKYQYGI